MRDIVEPTETPDGRGGTTLRHPAFGQVVVSKVSGRRTLYGSDFEHSSYVTLSIFGSEVTRDLSHDWPHRTQHVVSIALREAQWAAMVSSFGSGSRTQVTLDTIGGDMMPAFPLRDAGQFYKQEGDESLQRALANIGEAAAAIEAIPASAKAKAVALGKIRKAHQELASNIGFVAKSFGEHLEARAEKAKVEVYAWIQNTVTRAGLSALKKEQPLQIEEVSARPRPQDQRGRP